MRPAFGIVDGQSLSDSFETCPWGIAPVAQAGGEKGNDQHKLIPMYAIRSGKFVCVAGLGWIAQI